MTASAGLTAWKMAFQLSPIVLTNGLVQEFPGFMVPIIAITEVLSLALGILNGSDITDTDAMFAQFRPAPGATIIHQDIGKYPFANSAVAANAVIQQPLQLSMIMDVPAKGFLGYPGKLISMMALQAALDQHNKLGGTFIVATPSFIYTDLILTSLRDVTGGSATQPQQTWQWDFEKPLLTLEGAQQVQSSWMNRISNLNQIVGLPPYTGFGAAAAGVPSLAGAALPVSTGGIAAGIQSSPITVTPLPPL